MLCIPLIGRIRIRTWTKIESACFCHLTNSFIKFCHNTSTTILDIMLHTVFELISKCWRTTWELNNSRIWIQIFNKIELIRPCHAPNLSTTKLRPNPSTNVFETSCSQSDRGENILPSCSFGGEVITFHFKMNSKYIHDVKCTGGMEMHVRIIVRVGQLNVLWRHCRVRRRGVRVQGPSKGTRGHPL